MGKNWRRRSQSAQGMVEFALVLPILLLIILAIFAFGHFMFVYITTVSASREAARYGAAIGPSENGIPRFSDCTAIRQAARRVGSIAGISTIAITFDNGITPKTGSNCAGATLTNPGDVGLGDRIIVEVTTNYTPIVPLVNIPAFPIISRSARTILRAAPVGTAEVALPGMSPTKDNTTLTIVSDNPDYSIVDQPVDIVFSLTKTGTGAAPTGKVQLTATDKDGANTVLPEQDLTLGTTISFTPNKSGAWTFKVVYKGDNVNNPSQDTEPHQVYYQTAVSITSVSPASPYIGQAVDINYSITPTPAVAGSEKPALLQITVDGVLHEIANPDWTGTLSLAAPAFTTSGLKNVTITLPTGDPNFLTSTSSTTIDVQGGEDTFTSITGIVNANSSKPTFDIGDSIKVRVLVEAPSVPEKPVGTVRVSEPGGMTCDVTLLSTSNGTGECTITITSRGSGMLNFKASYTPVIPNFPIFDSSESSVFPISIAELQPVLSVLGHTPDPSGVYNGVTVTFTAAPPVAVGLTVTGSVTVNIGGATCTGTLGANGNPAGQGSCVVTPTVIGTFPVTLTYNGGSDTNFEGPGNQSPAAPNHTVAICPTVTYRAFLNTPASQAPQMVVTVSNPLTTAVSILQVNATWPTTVQKMYIKQLFFFQANGNASSWACNAGNGCLYDAPGGTGVVSYEDGNTVRDYFSSVLENGSCSQYGSEPVGTCFQWKNNATASLAPAETKDLYLVLSVNAQKTGWFNVRLRTNNQTCPWIQSEFLNNTN